MTRAKRNLMSLSEKITIKLSAPFEKNADLCAATAKAQTAVTIAIDIIYPCMVIYLIWAGICGQDAAGGATADSVTGVSSGIAGFFASTAVRSIIIPAAGLLIVSVVRKLINAPRPCEVLGCKPLVPRKKGGCSFPSRHLYSAFVIAMVALLMHPAIFAALIAMGTFLGYCRVALRIHFFRDVLAGAAAGVAMGMLLFV